MESAMRALFVAAIVTVGLCVAPTIAGAQERLGDGAMGAIAGAIVGGPIGAVAGGVVGYTAGPHIARGMGLKGHRHYHHYAYHDRRGREEAR